MLGLESFKVDKTAYDPMSPYNRVYTTEEFWKTPMGAISFPRELEAAFVLQKVRTSTERVFKVLAAQAITRNGSAEHGNGVRVLGPGHRKWSQRGLAKACNLAVNTIRQALKELAALGYIEFFTSSLGTLVQVIGFKRFMRSALTTINPLFKKPRVSNSDTYRISPIKDLYKLTSIVDVPQENKEEAPILKTSDPGWAAIKAQIAKIKGL